MPPVMVAGPALLRAVPAPATSFPLEATTSLLAPLLELLELLEPLKKNPTSSGRTLRMMLPVTDRYPPPRLAPPTFAVDTYICLAPAVSPRLLRTLLPKIVDAPPLCTVGAMPYQVPESWRSPKSSM